MYLTKSELKEETFINSYLKNGRIRAKTFLSLKGKELTWKVYYYDHSDNIDHRMAPEYGGLFLWEKHIKKIEKEGLWTVMKKRLHIPELISPYQRINLKIEN